MRHSGCLLITAPTVGPPTIAPTTSSDGGGCSAATGERPVDPVLPLLAALGLIGWGLRRTRRGWLYNVSGFDAVLLRLTNGRSVMVGTDEPRRLKTAIERAQART